MAAPPGAGRAGVGVGVVVAAELKADAGHPVLGPLDEGVGPEGAQRAQVAAAALRFVGVDVKVMCAQPCIFSIENN